MLAAPARAFVRPDDATSLVINDLREIEKGARELGLSEAVVLDAQGNPLPR